MSQFSRGKKQNQVTPLQVTQCSFQAIQLGKKSSPDGQKKPQQTNYPFMCPFNKIYFHSYFTTLFKTKGEQLPHAKHSLHSRVLTTIPTRGHSSLGRTMKGFKAAHTRTQQFYWFITLK